MGRLFGTDGVRGIANTELTCERAMEIGRAAATIISDGSENKSPTFLIGADTRASSDMLCCALSAGLCSVGANVINLGVIPTPAVAYLVVKYGADAGIMISASHNPAEFNGIKIFNGSGFKLADMLEERIEEIVLDKVAPPVLAEGASVGKVIYEAKEAIKDYVDHLVDSLPNSLTGLNIAVDCANGSSSIIKYFIIQSNYVFIFLFQVYDYSNSFLGINGIETENVVSVWLISISLCEMILYFSFSPFNPTPVESAGIGRGDRLLVTIILLSSIKALMINGFEVDIMLCLQAFSINICIAVGTILIEVTATSVG